MTAMTPILRAATRRSPIVRGVASTLAFLLVVPLSTVSAIAQTPTPTTKPGQTPTPTAKPGQTPTVTANPTAGDKDYVKLTADQLDSLVAPIALYPDPLLSQTLVASTYPLELVQAQQFIEKNDKEKKLKGDELSKAVEKEKWDPSVQATAVVPDLLKRLTEDITWTLNLGNAFLEQQDDVMNAVQRLRKKAKDAGKLDSSEQAKVETKVVETKTVIEIVPTSTSVVYVPTYSPTVIWGPPLYYPYPPIYYPPYYGGAWVGFGVGVAVGIGISGGWGWGCGWGGGGNNIYINNNNNFVKNNNINTGNIGRGNGNSNWNHNPSHRGGAPYASNNTASKFGGNTGARTNATGSGLGSGSSSRPGATSAGANRAGATGSGLGSSGSRTTAGGGDRVGSRSVPSSSSRTSGGFGGMSGGASRAGASSARGGGSMGGGGRR